MGPPGLDLSPARPRVRPRSMTTGIMGRSVPQDSPRAMGSQSQRLRSVRSSAPPRSFPLCFVQDAEAALQLKAHQYDDATSRAAAQSREIRLMIADAERLREALDAATTRAAAAADAEARGASALEQETARARQSDALCAEQQRAIAALEAEVTTLKTESAALQDRLQQERRERRDAAARGGAAQDALQQLQAETDALRREAAAGAQKLAAAQQSAQQLTARVAQLTADVGHGRDREAALQQRLADLDIFKLDVIARELKKVELLLSNSKTTVQSYIASDAKRITHFGERDAVVLFLREVCGGRRPPIPRLYTPGQSS